MLNAKVGQHGNYVTATGEAYHARVIEVTDGVVLCRVTFPENGCTVYGFSRATGQHRMGTDWGKLLLRTEQLQEATNAEAS